MSRRRGFARVLTVVLGLGVPAMAHACAVCFSGSPRVREAFFNMTIMLSLVPLALLFVGAWALRRASGMVPSEEFAVTDNSLAPAEPAPATVGDASATVKRPGAIGPEAIESA